MKKLILLLAPVAPHFAEEMWEVMGQPYSVFEQEFPAADESALVKSVINMALQLNGKVRRQLEVAADMTPAEIEAYVRENYADVWKDKEVKKVIVVPGRLVNVVAG